MTGNSFCVGHVPVMTARSSSNFWRTPWVLEEEVILIPGAGNGIGRCHASSPLRAQDRSGDLGGSRHGEGTDDSAASKVAEEIKAEWRGRRQLRLRDRSGGQDRMVAMAVDT